MFKMTKTPLALTAVGGLLIFASTLGKEQHDVSYAVILFAAFILGAWVALFDNTLGDHEDDERGG
ncbi:hypothetical protein [Streptomyces sp. C1-2]|uniref:hypothetical protein n=1 Tax=Streptomyces sp. C1-2 TaxID=2720022 RepID=UPI0014326C37|nr:hypothetical protein [Streptomyces sp. C1-2]NJP70683.1 hypothetical protein [Streptomyces sp. C1-2]